MKTLFIMVGIPGSGKSWFAKQKILPHSHAACVSRDEIRFELLGDSEDYFSHEKEVYKNFVEEVVHGLKNPLYDVVVADATHINWASRRKLINSIGSYFSLDNQLNIVPVVVKCTLDTALKRNSERGGRAYVPEDVIKNMYGRMQDPSRDPFNYDGIMYVKNNYSGVDFY